MARIRTIKPEFFTSDRVAEVSRDARLLFVGLWTMADRDGRLDDRAKRIKATLFPYDDDANVEEWLCELAAKGLIVRYEAGGARIEIPGFKEHQRPHPKETESRIPPAHPDNEQAVKRNGKPLKETASHETPGTIPSSPAGKGREGKGREAHDRAREAELDLADPDRVGTACDPLNPVANHEAELLADPRGVTPMRLAALWAQVRIAEGAGIHPWHASQPQAEKADGVAQSLREDPSAAAAVVPTMRTLLQLAQRSRSGADPEDERIRTDAAFGWGAWCARFHGLREALARGGQPGKKPRPPSMYKPLPMD